MRIPNTGSYKDSSGKWKIVFRGHNIGQFPEVILAVVWVLVFIVLALVLGGCALVKQDTDEGWSHSGYVSAGIYPRHNESILNHYGDITEGKAEIKEVISYNRWNLIINPEFLVGGSWPVTERPTGQVYWNHHGQWIYMNLGYGLEYRLWYQKNRGNWYVGYLKEQAYELWHDQTGHKCNCTYSNFWYLKYSWE